jgi:hypothetical protein
MFTRSKVPLVLFDAVQRGIDAENAFFHRSLLFGVERMFDGKTGLDGVLGTFQIDFKVDLLLARGGGTIVVETKGVFTDIQGVEDEVVLTFPSARDERIAFGINDGKVNVVITA